MYIFSAMFNRIVFLIFFSSVGSFLVYKKAIDSRLFILYPTNLLNWFISCNSSLVEFFGSSMSRILSYTNKDNFQLEFFLFLSLIWQLWLNFCVFHWRQMTRVHPLFFFLIIVGILSVFPHLVLLAMGLWKIAFISLSQGPYITFYLVKVFYERMLDFLKVSFCVHQDIHHFLCDWGGHVEKIEKE